MRAVTRLRALTSSHPSRCPGLYGRRRVTGAPPVAVNSGFDRGVGHPQWPLCGAKVPQHWRKGASRSQVFIQSSQYGDCGPNSCPFPESGETRSRDAPECSCAQKSPPASEHAHAQVSCLALAPCEPMCADERQRVQRTSDWRRLRGSFWRCTPDPCTVRTSLRTCHVQWCGCVCTCAQNIRRRPARMLLWDGSGDLWRGASPFVHV